MRFTSLAIISFCKSLHTSTATSNSSQCPHGIIPALVPSSTEVINQRIQAQVLASGDNCNAEIGQDSQTGGKCGWWADATQCTGTGDANQICALERVSPAPSQSEAQWSWVPQDAVWMPDAILDGLCPPNSNCGHPINQPECHACQNDAHCADNLWCDLNTKACLSTPPSTDEKLDSPMLDQTLSTASQGHAVDRVCTANVDCDHLNTATNLYPKDQWNNWICDDGQCQPDGKTAKYSQIRRSAFVYTNANRTYGAGITFDTVAPCRNDNFIVRAQGSCDSYANSDARCFLSQANQQYWSPAVATMNEPPAEYKFTEITCKAHFNLDPLQTFVMMMPYRPLNRDSLQVESTLKGLYVRPTWVTEEQVRAGLPLGRIEFTIDDTTRITSDQTAHDFLEEHQPKMFDMYPNWEDSTAGSVFQKLWIDLSSVDALSFNAELYTPGGMLRLSASDPGNMSLYNNVSWTDKLATNQMITTEEGLQGIWGPKRRSYDATNSVCYGVGGPHAAMDCSPNPDPQAAENQWDSFLAGCGETAQGPNGGDWMQGRHKGLCRIWWGVSDVGKNWSQLIHTYTSSYSWAYDEFKIADTEGFQQLVNGRRPYTLNGVDFSTASGVDADNVAISSGVWEDQPGVLTQGVLNPEEALVVIVLRDMLSQSGPATANVEVEENEDGAEGDDGEGRVEKDKASAGFQLSLITFFLIFCSCFFPQ